MDDSLNSIPVTLSEYVKSLNHEDVAFYIEQLTVDGVQLPDPYGNVRIHVEKVIGKMRNYLILQSTIPVNQVHLLDDIVVIIAALTNILPSIVPSSYTILH
jgi:hypothetical protein